MFFLWLNMPFFLQILGLEERNMSMIKVKLWLLDKNEKNQLHPVQLEEVGETETEKQLENILVNNPELLMPGLKLIGRQTPTDRGLLDLLGVDEDGNLIVFGEMQLPR
jgi:RecB family endonuclease NucS